MRARSITTLLVIGALAGCTAPPPPSLTPAALAATPWAQIAGQARGTTVALAMWAGDEARNRFFRDTVAPALAADLGITLRVVPVADVADVVNKLLTERSANAGGSIDIVWMNGENFRTARQGGVLWGPFADAVPNVRLYDAAARNTDFGTPTEGYEVPWEAAQFVFAYDTQRMSAPPRTLDDLRAWIADHPGRFTYPAIPDFTGSAFIRHVLLHQPGVAVSAFSGPFDEAAYARTASRALAWLRDIRPSLWRGGETYPATPADMHRLFANHEIDLTMSYGPGFASERIARGEFPPTTRTFVLDAGTLANYSFLAVPFNAPNPPGALAAINRFLSEEHALATLETLGGVLPFTPDRLTPDARRRFDAIPRGPATLALETLAAHRLLEPDVQYLIWLEADWRREVLLR